MVCRLDEQMILGVGHRIAHHVKVADAQPVLRSLVTLGQPIN
jgi:hypothetical protein